MQYVDVLAATQQFALGRPHWRGSRACAFVGGGVQFFCFVRLVVEEWISPLLGLGHMPRESWEDRQRFRHAIMRTSRPQAAELG